LSPKLPQNKLERLTLQFFEHSRSYQSGTP
jgi:hypothetical protein